MAKANAGTEMIFLFQNVIRVTIIKFFGTYVANMYCVPLFMAQIFILTQKLVILRHAIAVKKKCDKH